MLRKYVPFLAFLPFVIALGYATQVYAKKLGWGTEEAKPHAKIQVALLLDISNSMDGLIDQAKAKLWQVVTQLGDARFKDNAPRLEIALYAYGGTELDPNTGYVKQMTPLTTDLDLISELLFGLKTAGGDEYCGTVIQAAQALSWTDNDADLRMIFIAGNEPFNQGNYPYPTACKEAKKKGIIVNTIFCGARQEGENTFWQHGAQLANGAYLNIDQNQQVVYIETPYDQKITQLNSQLNQTYLAYGVQGQQLQQRQLTQDENANSYGLANFAGRAIAKCQDNYSNAHWDLVDACEQKQVDLAELDKSQLPEALQKLSTEELKQLVAEKAAERKRIQQSVLELHNVRTAYILEQQKNQPEGNTLDAALLQIIQKQAGDKGYRFEGC